MSTNIEWETISLFQDLPDYLIDKVKPIFEVRTINAGNDLITEGDQGDEMFILIRGRVRITKSMLMQGMNLPIMEVNTPRKVLATLDQTHYPVFGEIALIDRDTRSATIQVLEDAEFLVTNRDRFFELAEKHPHIGNHMLMAVAKRMASTIRKGNSELVKVSTALALALSRYKTIP
ncbi:cyclic nucleotide-binding domain-containing protein [Pseudodesulfovibrio sp. zrk46]|uniref:cyclic nucleotide-binding domain-containing protein n=1 Tax=Pseudodesulfovibrio sp. zrk46 TaxID=2725288 RepID=UPI0014496B35|nr:cyclic nucleotide-binding domain-containing protein [Pseudodesulfovibrio sp. zrk46]QJB55942.1 cyclic nucleotide-binding domain-containing protein [Pseudodesulfovibrio sp. zrk46]